MTPPNEDPRLRFNTSPAKNERNKESQPYSTFQALNVQPDAVTNLKLSGGRSMPYVYSLGISSTVPFVRLIGGASSQKLFSWNEPIIVPPGQFVTVANASYHPGDIYIQSGADPSAKAGRVTVPFTLREVTVGQDTYLEPTTVVDTRRARRAYVVGFSATNNDQANYPFIAIGISRGRSHTVNPTYSTEGADADALYYFQTDIPPFTEPGLLPLGNKALPNDTVHDLLDFATFVYYDLATESRSGGFHYVLEYL